MPGRTREGARVSRLYKLKMQGKVLDKPKEDKTEKKVVSDKKDSKKNEKKESKLDKVKKIFEEDKTDN